MQFAPQASGGPRVSALTLKNYQDRPVRLVGRICSNNYLDPVGNSDSKSFIRIITQNRLEQGQIVEIHGKVTPQGAIAESGIVPLGDFDLTNYNSMLSLASKYDNVFGWS
mmetsp:Transcript_2086/g.3908  ORF Transcript_2086/g.3908 Transcript_2086/m.3908 type:complete len:110 (-) Transcript_2086:489-818(-)